VKARGGGKDRNVFKARLLPVFFNKSKTPDNLFSKQGGKAITLEKQKNKGKTSNIGSYSQIQGLPQKRAS